MEKCVFIGYPAGYKGWKFYNPTTKRTIISERADFDERYFPGLKKTSTTAIPTPPLPPSLPSPTICKQCYARFKSTFPDMWQGILEAHEQAAAYMDTSKTITQRAVEFAKAKTKLIQMAYHTIQHILT
ncbi:hypothetical protein SERLA73DRAFT_78655 [Serpula lacrymans var. lacrymans S7.3]|uniref:Retroviral polymerase SH3-like domain-containing protein n=1 Tax=Serpula lacrymans var. lacrymans (strain S7.3) TaxID=936435 RepID=F8QDX6_SERL3|nr:hypothetical protein SERLA73DRAFT_78655 [Serpula lacrymans var. lacrymans S7.3]